MHKPSFFIIGAPKCGTTALSRYLSDHPSICFSASKEPYHFSSDFPGMGDSLTAEQYVRAQFGHCAEGAIAGEGTAGYLYSETAVANILAFNPKARFIVMLRDPVDVAVSLHAQMCFNLDEDVSDFARAWALQSERAAGRSLPPLCREPQFLQYRKVVSFGAQLQRLFALVPRERVLLILFDELAADPLAVYRRTLDFLCVPYDGRTHFPVVNARRRYRFRLLAQLVNRPPAWAVRAAAVVKRLPVIGRVRPWSLLEKWSNVVNARPARSAVATETRDAVRAVLVEDVELLEAITGLDLAAWRASKAASRLQ